MEVGFATAVDTKVGQYHCPIARPILFWLNDGSSSTEENPDACIASLGRPAAQEGIKALMARGFHKPGDVENRLGYYLGQIGRKAGHDSAKIFSFSLN